jgi:general secretion pathway protein D
MIPSTQTLILRDSSENVKRMLEMLEKIDIPPVMEIKSEVIPIKYALAGDISQALSSLSGGGGGAVSVGKSGSTGLSGGRLSGGSSSSTANPYPGGVNQPNTSSTGSGSTMGGFGSSRGGAASAARSSFQNNLQKIIKNAASAGEFQILGQTKIIADERTNSLLVFANDQDMAMIKNIISKLDVVLAQVLIEAIVMEVSLGDNRNIGISYLQNKQQAGSFTGTGGLNNLSSSAGSFLNGGASGSNSAPANLLTALPGGFSYFAKLNNDLDIVLEAVQSDSRVNVLSRPRIQTSHAVEADLFIGDSIPMISNTYYNGGYNGGPSSQYEMKDVGIELHVMPLINADGLVVMDIQQDIEELGKTYNIQGVGDVPSTTKRSANAKVAVRDRETIILGGFISSTRSRSHSGIPFLMNVPLLGALFRSDASSNDRVELVVLIRPTVLRTPEIAAVVAASERNKLTGVKQAEMELSNEERARYEKIERDMRKEQARKAAKEKAIIGNAVPGQPDPALEPQ